MELYSIEVYYSLKGNSYTEKSRLCCTNKLFKSAEEAIKALANDIDIKYNNRDYRGLQVNLPKIGKYGISMENFQCAYTFGPMVYYDCYIEKKKIEL